MSEGGQVALLNETKINVGDFDMNIPRHILSPDETCHYCGLSLSSLSRLRQEHDFPQAIRLGKRRIGFIKSDIDEWLSQQRIELPVDTTPKVKVKSPQTVEDLEKIHRRNIKKLFNSQ